MPVASGTIPSACSIWHEERWSHRRFIISVRPVLCSLGCANYYHVLNSNFVSLPPPIRRSNMCRIGQLRIVPGDRIQGLHLHYMVDQQWQQRRWRFQWGVESSAKHGGVESESGGECGGQCQRSSSHQQSDTEAGAHVVWPRWAGFLRGDHDGTGYRGIGIIGEYDTLKARFMQILLCRSNLFLCPV